MPARDLFNMELYFEKGKGHNIPEVEPCTQIITSRGCPYKCTFCALGNHWGKRQRKRSPENVLKEIRYLVDNYGIKEVHFEDDNLTSDKERALKIFHGIKEMNFDLKWNAPSGLSVAHLDEELLYAMKDSGCYSISLAIESGDEDVLKRLMHKPVSLTRAKKVVSLARNCGLLVKAFFMLGYPGETKKTIQKTIDFAKILELDWSFFFIATPVPHTPMWNTCVENGYFDPANYDPVKSIVLGQIHTPEFEPYEVEMFREEAIIECNFRNNANLRKYNVYQAIKDFKNVLRTYPNFDFAHVALGEAYARINKIETARKCWKEALKYNSKNKDALKLLAS